jgi:dienelactone hydrolase
VALHDHGGFKFLGKEKIADGPNGAEPGVSDIRSSLYEGRAFVNELARRGFVVLVHDVFLWGSRRFPLEVMPERMHQLAALLGGSEIQQYNEAARFHEHLVAKYAALLGTTISGIVSAEDRVAVRYLQSRPEVRTEHIGCIGLSGGGNRAAMLQATCDDVRAAVVVGMMCTYPALLDRYIEPTTWMFLPNGWSRYGDWPDLAACRAPSPLLVQYLRHDHLFTLAGMQAAHDRIAAHYASAGHPEAYEGAFYDGDHRFSIEMQGAAFDWLVRQLHV